MTDPIITIDSKIFNLPDIDPYVLESFLSNPIKTEPYLFDPELVYIPLPKTYDPKSAPESSDKVEYKIKIDHELFDTFIPYVPKTYDPKSALEQACVGGRQSLMTAPQTPRASLSGGQK